MELNSIFYNLIIIVLNYRDEGTSGGAGICMHTKHFQSGAEQILLKKAWSTALNVQLHLRIKELLVLNCCRKRAKSKGTFRNRP